jgi:phosphoserine phosphatase
VSAGRTGIVYLARHGETDWNRDGRYQGQLESQLTALGVEQAAALARALACSGATRVVASPLARCVQTAFPVAAALGVAVETDPSLLEIAHGNWEGRLRSDIERDDAPRMAAWQQAPDTVRFPGGESLDDVAARWAGFAATLDGKTDTVVVTHDVLVRLAILVAQRRPFRELWQTSVHNGGYARFEVASGSWRLLDECCEAHLGGLLADTSRQAL